MLLRYKPWFKYKKNHYQPQKIAVVGSGLIGTTSAYFLDQNNYTVHLFEQASTVANDASGNLSGLVLPVLNKNYDVRCQFFSQALTEAINFYLPLCQENPQLGKISHTLWLGDELSIARIKKTVTALQHTPFPHKLDWLRDEQIQSLTLKTNIQHVLQQSGGWINPKGIIELLIKKSKIDLRLQKKITQLKEKDGVWTLNIEDTSQLAGKNHQQTEQFDAVILCTGANTKLLTSYTPELVKYLQTTFGCVSYLTKDKIKKINIGISSSGFVAPNNFGITVGATYSKNNTESVATTNNKNIKLLNKLFSRQGDGEDFDINDIFGYKISQRLSANDRLPIVGNVSHETFLLNNYQEIYKNNPRQNFSEVEYIPNLYLNTAHGSRGYTTAVATAKIITALVNNQTPNIKEYMLQKIHPNRFFIRKLIRHGI